MFWMVKFSIVCLLDLSLLLVVARALKKVTHLLNRNNQVIRIGESV